MFLQRLQVRCWLLERPRHPGYWTWKSGGLMGHRLGIIGSSMMVLMLLYSVRKRVKWLRRLGPLSNWLDLHIFLGVIGPLLVGLEKSVQIVPLGASVSEIITAATFAAYEEGAESEG